MACLGHVHSFVCSPDWRACLLSCCFVFLFFSWNMANVRDSILLVIILVANLFWVSTLYNRKYRKTVYKHPGSVISSGSSKNAATDSLIVWKHFTTHTITSTVISLIVKVQFKINSNNFRTWCHWKCCWHSVGTSHTKKVRSHWTFSVSISWILNENVLFLLQVIFASLYFLEEALQRTQPPKFDSHSRSHCFFISALLGIAYLGIIKV